ncbi:GNAT family N-acetyltransferase [Alteriqipengyuania sp. WL0013]|uniref:GNAT family N-acetyltransferase n=1 Tax=Alteriqipengyuania sp. WL0013 TaxID=3110773 RepID=UPI002C8D2995|nr:GNAT family N-acetyltransferase [Alteriqipengyuania sp. WL0013]MEB3416180.1 GNAT family N-acetyltransferase [Alteriqipengyuania sp. WL0013]
MADREWTVELAPGVSAFTAAEWDAMAGTANPFVKHGFLSALEDSGSVGPGTGWQAMPLVVRDENGAPRAALPAYAKGHSQGEYVFDHAWADAWERAGGDYYPKLQISVPFTPATGPRILGDTDLAPALFAAARQVVARHDWSSAHATFIEPAQQALFEDAGWLLRSDIQFHWHNRDYADFDGFLADLASRKRKAIRKERARAVEGLEIVHLIGDEIKVGHWDAFWVFYQDTGARKWGTPYLTRAAFDLFGERLGEDLVLMLALAEGVPVAGALNFIGEDALYGRYWGCTEDRPFLHFELCYYQAIDVAIARGLSRVEAGAQGGHKLARGYEPVETVSAHWMPDPGFRSAVADFLERERAGVKTDRMFLGERTPFRKGG